MKKPVAFMSYAHRDDKDGRLTKLREHLSHEVSLQTGEDFEIFQDRDNIQWGQNWKVRIEQSIDEVTFLIPVITPSFFNSSHCKDELKQFIDREQKLGRNDLILPVYYIDTPLLNDEKKRQADELAQVIHQHQYADWRTLRDRSWSYPRVRRTLVRLATQVCNALQRISEGDFSSGLFDPSSRSELSIDDVIIEKREQHICLDVRLRNPGSTTVNVTQADLHVLGRVPYAAAYTASASYDLLLKDEHNVLTVAHVLQPNEVDSFVIRIGFTSENTSCEFTAKLVLHYNGEYVTTSKPFRFDSVLGAKSVPERSNRDEALLNVSRKVNPNEELPTLGDDYSEAEQMIRRHCERQWPNDYSMRNYCTKQQRKALATLKRDRPHDIPEEVFARIRNKCAMEWPDDYAMRQYCEQQQFDSYRELERESK